MAKRLDDIIVECTDEYIKTLGKYNVMTLFDKAKAMDIRNDILDSISHEVTMENTLRKQAQQSTIKAPESLPQYSIAELILHTNDFKLVKMSEGGEICLAMNAYDMNGKFLGVMQLIDMTSQKGKKKDPGRERVKALCKALSPNITMTKLYDVVESVEASLSDLKKMHEYTRVNNKNHHLVACNNGIWDFDTQEFTAHDAPDRWTKYPDIIFLNKLDTNWVPMATSPAFVQPDGTTWTVDTFFESLFDGNTVIGRASIDILWEIIHFAIRQYGGQEGHMVYLCNALNGAKGKNGKSTLIDLIKFVIDHFSVQEYASKHRMPLDRVVNGQKIIQASIDKWSEDHMLAESIQSAMFVVSDENEEGNDYITGSGFLKNMARNQPNLYNPKFGTPFSYACPCLKMHAQNETTRMNSTDEANFTHRIELRMEMDFSDKGNGNPLVKSQYVIDEKVAEYILWKVTTQMPCMDDFSKDLLKVLDANIEDTKKDNIPVSRFLDEVLDGFNLQRIPAKWLYEMFDKSWRTSEGIVKKITFKRFKEDLNQYIYNNRDKYEWTDKPFYFTSEEVDTEKKYKMAHAALLEYGIYNGLGLDFVNVDMINNERVASNISSIAMKKQVTSGALVKKAFACKTNEN